MRIVITGGPCSGKTTLIRRLSLVGYDVIHESARIVYERYKLHPIKDFVPFQAKVFDLQRRMELERSNARILFQDRSAVDGIAYYYCTGMEAPREFYEYARICRFAAVFLLDLLPFLERDGIRAEDEIRRACLDLAMEKVYRELGYNTVRVPAAPEDERLRAILQCLKQSFPSVFGESSF